jgi:hypothetical protein
MTERKPASSEMARLAGKARRKGAREREVTINGERSTIGSNMSENVAPGRTHGKGSIN